VDLFRVFDWDGASIGRTPGGPLFVTRARQGSGRHDAPIKYGAWYCAQEAVSAVGETIQFLRGHTLGDDDFRRADGTRKALVRLRLDDGLILIDLDDPRALIDRRLRPSRVATGRRSTTQAIAASIFDDGADGLLWWSTLEAEWTNATLFHERAVRRVQIADGPRLLTVALSEVREAAERLGVALP
jgi:hypothetical protein